MRLCTDDDVSTLLSLADLLPVVSDALVAQGAGRVERPPRPHYPVGGDDDGRNPAGTALTMPAYLHGADTYATKLASVHEGNPEQGLPTIHAQVMVNDAHTGEALALFDGVRVTNARTSCVGGLAISHLVDGPVTLGVLGGGAQARWQTRAVDAATDLRGVKVYSPNSREACATDLRAEGIDARAVESPEEAVRGSNAVVTATTSREPVFPGSALDPGTVVVGIGAYTDAMRELDGTTMERAARVFADVPEEVAEVGDVADAGLAESDLVPFSDVLTGEAGRDDAEEILVVDSVGSAVMDAATADYLYERALAEDVGRDVEF